MKSPVRGALGWDVTSAGLLLPRRRVLRGGLAGFAAAMMSPVLARCESAPAATSDAGRLDAPPAPRDGGPDAAAVEFPARTIPARPALRSLLADVGPLGAANADGVRLPAGFTARILARSADVVAGTSYVWPQFPDGATTFLTEDGGWIYVVNSEFPAIGGASAVRFEPDGTLRSAYRILDGTNINCSGGSTPWHTWLSAEEHAEGRVYECDPWGETEAVWRPALGVFKHEAAAFDPVRNHVFLTEDQTDGRFYRFVPDGTTPLGRPNLAAGALEVATVAGDGTVTWTSIPDPLFTGALATREQVLSSTPFDGGEGVWYHQGLVYFSTKGDNRIWVYDIAANTITVFYDGTDPGLDGVDAVTVSCCGDVLVAEDGGMMRLVAILPGGELRTLLQIEGQDGSEITGPTFDPSGTRLYFSSQRGADGNGVTYEVTGPFHAPA